MRSYVAYQLINGTPRRVLSLSTRRPGGHGTAHPGDAPGPKEFFQAAAFLSEGERPTTFPMTEKDMTPEMIAEKAKKFNVLPEDYYPMSMKTGGPYGDYPVTVNETWNNKSANYEWDDFFFRSNYGEPIGINQPRDYGPYASVSDAHYHPYGFYQYYEYFKKYTWQYWLSGIAVLLAVFRLEEKHNEYKNDCNSRASMGTSALYCGKFWYNKHWSHTELEFREVYNKMQQAKMGYPGYSDTHDVMRCQDTTAYFMAASGSTAGRDRHGPTGSHPIRREAQDIYMVPAGAMGFKALAWVDYEKSGNDLSPEKSLQKTLHPHAGHNKFSSHYTVSTGSDVVEE